MHSHDVVVAAAFAPELEALRARFGAGSVARVGALEVAFREVGVGLVAAAVGARALFDATRPRALVLVGTAGAYPARDLAIGDVVVARRAIVASASEALGAGALVAPMARAHDAEPRLVSGLASLGAPIADVATTLALTTDDALAGRLADATGASLEHLEAFAVAAACASCGVPFAAALGVANVVGARGRDEWRAHHLSASAVAGELVARWLEVGAPGLAERRDVAPR